MRTEDLPRLDSMADAWETSQSTDVSDVVADLARLSDVMSIPRILPSDGMTAVSLDPSESWMCSLVKLGMCIQGILDLSPLDEDDTLRILARLVGLRVVTLMPSPRAS